MINSLPVIEMEHNSSKNILLEAKNITKVFPGTVALDDVSFNVYKGKVNVLIGENGAGKSTLMKILAGVEQPTSGKIFLDGQEINPRNPIEANNLGIGMIFQELNLCPNLSVADNIFLAREKTKHGFLDRKQQKQCAQDLIKQLEQKINPEELVGNLRLGDQQIVEISKALAQNARILIMDEPTSALSAAEVEVLFRLIDDLKSHGVTIIYISHKLEEILQIGDCITILRDGAKVAEADCQHVNINWIIEKMVGRDPADFFTPKVRNLGDILLKVENLALPRLGGGFLVDNVSFELRKGEILGFYGLMGAGRSDLVDCLAGAHPLSTGKVWLDGNQVTAETIPGRIESGFVLVPEDRQQFGLVNTLSVMHNMLLSSLKKYLKGALLSVKKEKFATSSQIKNLSIRVADPQLSITSLSGGNQQKVVVAKGLLTEPKVLLLDEPTRGIDVGSKSEIFEIVYNLAERGFGVIFVSSELKEILAMADRILVMSKGKITGEFTRKEATEEKLVAASAIGHGISNGGNNNGKSS